MDFTPVLSPTIFPVISASMIIDEVIFLAHSLQDTIDWLRARGLLAQGMICKCGIVMNEKIYSHSQDGYTWRCPACRNVCSIRYRSFFTPSKLSLPSLFKFLYYWCEDLQSHAFLEKQLMWSPNTVVDWKNFLRDVCMEELIANPEPLGGPGKIVEIDESKFGKRKYNRGRLLTGQWVFGIVEKDTNKVVMFSVTDRSTATLLPIIQQYVLPGTTIHSDEWAAYFVLSTQGYIHETVNHSENFVDPVTGAHTQQIEGSWGIVKKRLRKGQTTNPELLETHLIESCWRRRNKENVFNNIVRAIRTMYPVV